LLLEAEDLTAGVDYTRDLLRLLMAKLFGCGVVCGLEVTAERTCRGQKLEITVASGLALDCGGNAVHVPVPTTVTYDPHLKCQEMPKRVWVTVCYLEKCCRPKDVACSPDEDASILHTRSRDAFTIKVYGEWPSCACACTRELETDGNPTTSDLGAEKATNCDCYTEHNDGTCACGCDCECVLLAEIDTTHVDVNKDPKKAPEYKRVEESPESPLRVITRDVRRIRPLQTGFRECLEPRSGTTGTETGGTGTGESGSGGGDTGGTSTGGAGTGGPGTGGRDT
jgi:hypothetical protein